jgi:hypothetical protein
VCLKYQFSKVCIFCNTRIFLKFIYSQLIQFYMLICRHSLFSWVLSAFLWHVFQICVC